MFIMEMLTGDTIWRIHWRTRCRESISKPVVEESLWRVILEYSRYPGDRRIGALYS